MFALFITISSFFPLSQILVMSVTPVHNVPIVSTVFIDSILSSMIPPSNDDSLCLFAISLFYALIHNEGVDPHLLEAFSLKETKVMGNFVLSGKARPN